MASHPGPQDGGNGKAGAEGLQCSRQKDPFHHATAAAKATGE